MHYTQDFVPYLQLDVNVNQFIPRFEGIYLRLLFLRQVCLNKNKSVFSEEVKHVALYMLHCDFDPRYIVTTFSGIVECALDLIIITSRFGTISTSSIC